MVTVLISSMGRRVGLIQCFRDSAQKLGLGIRVLGCDAEPEMAPAKWFVDSAFKIPRCSEPDFINKLLNICKDEHVDLLVPTIDTELILLASNKELFQAVGTTVAISALEVVNISRNKIQTARLLMNNQIETPRFATADEFLKAPERLKLPVILRPVAGSGSKGLIIVESMSELEHIRLDPQNYMAQEMYQGREYTVNMFFDRGGSLKCAIPHLRYEIRAGEVSKGITRRVPELINIARRMASALKGAYGPMCFQAIMDDHGKAVVFEINARFGGGYPLAHQAGARFAQWLIEDVKGLPSTASDEWQDGVVMLRFDSAVFFNLNENK